MNYQTMINNDAVFSLYLPAFPPAVGADIYDILAYLIIGEFPAGIIGIRKFSVQQNEGCGIHIRQPSTLTLNFNQ